MTDALRARLPRILTAAISLSCGLLLFVAVHGPVRGFLGDILVVVFLVSLLAVPPIGTARARLIAIGALSVGLEALQALHLVGKDAHWLLHLLLGSTFDPWDLLAYTGGLLVAWQLERRW